MEAVGAADDVGALPRAGEEVDRYRVLGLIATGGMAAVFAAARTSIGGFERLLALKVILPHLAGDRYFVDMFLDEARIVSRVHHANVVQVFDVVEHDGLPCIVMEFLHGRSLEAVLDSGIGVGLRLLVLAGAAKGLCAAHETLGPDGEPLGIVHRDVSPDNVHIGYDGHVKVVDFGIAAARGRLSSTRAGEVKGKLAYLAPEQLTASPNVTSKADVWSLGVVAWEVLAGERLFADDGDAATMWNVVHRPVPDIRDKVPELEPAVADAIMGCLERDPDARIEGGALALALSNAASARGATAAALAEHMATHFADDRRQVEAKLERTLSRVGQSMPELTSVVVPAVRERSRTPLWLGFAAAVAIGAGALGWAVAQSSSAGAAVASDAPPAAPPAVEEPRPAEQDRVDDATRSRQPEAAASPAGSAPAPAVVPADSSRPAPTNDAAPANEAAPASAPAPAPVSKSRRGAKKRRKARKAGETKAAPLMDSPY